MSTQIRDQQSWVVTVSMAVLAVLAIAFMLYFTRTVLIPFVVAIFIGAMVSPLMDIMELRYRFSHTSSIIISLLVVVVITCVFGLILLKCIQKVVDESERMSHDFQALYEKFSDNISEWIPGDASAPMPPPRWRDFPQDDQTADNLTDQPAPPETDIPTTENKSADGSLPPLLTGKDGLLTDRAALVAQAESEHRARAAEVSATSKDTAMNRFLRDQVQKFVGQLAASAMSFVSGGTLTLIFAMFVLAGRNPRIVRTGVYAEIDTQVRSYIGTKVALSITTGLLVWIILRMVRMPLADVFGLLACLLNFIPSVGSIIATIVPIPFALTVLGTDATAAGWIWLIVGVILLPGMVQMLIGNVLEPKLLGDGLHLHPITVLLALAIWGLLWGTVGMLLAVPMTAIIRIVLMRFEITQPAAKIMAGELPDLENRSTEPFAATS